MCGSYPSRPISADDPSSNDFDFSHEYERRQKIRQDEYEKQPKIKIDKFDDISVEDIEINQKYMDAADSYFKEFETEFTFKKKYKKKYLESFFIDDYNFDMEKIEKFLQIHKDVFHIEIEKLRNNFCKQLFRSYENYFLRINNSKREALHLSKMEPLDLSTYDIKKNGLEFILDKLMGRNLKETIMIFINIVMIYRARRVDLIQGK